MPSPAPRTLPTKRAIYDLYERGAFGAKHRTWPTLAAWRASGWTEPIALRYQGTGGGGFCAYSVPPSQVDATVAAWVARGADPARIKPCERGPAESTRTFQGEVCRSEHSLDLTYTTAPLPGRNTIVGEVRDY